MRCYAVQAFQVVAALVVVCVFFLLQGAFQDRRLHVVKKRNEDPSTSGIGVDDQERATTSMYVPSNEGKKKKGDCLEFTPSCPELQIAVPVLTARQRQALPNLVKSLLYYSRLATFKLHLVTNDLGERILITLFDTWELPQVKTEFYTPNQSKMSSKLFKRLGDNTSLLDTLGIVLMPSRNTKMYDKIMVAQPDILFLDDVLDVWNNMHSILNGKHLAFLESSVREDAPAKVEECEPRRLLLVDIKNLTSSVQAENKACSEESILVLNDPVSSVDKKALLSTLCTNLTSSVDVTTGPVHNITEIPCRAHPGIYGHTVHSYNYHTETLLLLNSLDGDIFRTMSTACVKPETPDYKLDPKDSCYEYKYLAKLKHRTHIQFLGLMETDTTNPYAVTLVTQLMVNRLGGLERQLASWEGPASVSLYLTDGEVGKFLDYVRQSAILSTRNNVVYHLVLARHKPPYPINYIRNIAIKEVVTPNYMMLDVDFVPNPGLQRQITDILSKLSPEKKRALVLPCFETKDISYQMPKNKTQFVIDLDAERVEAYHQKKGQWSAGHSFTDYNKWRKTNLPYRVRGKFGFEPYIVVPKKAPMYHEALLERMRDKLTYTIETEKAGYELFVLPESFTVHYPHEKSQILPASKSKGFQVCTYKIYNDIIKAIKKRYHR